MNITLEDRKKQLKQEIEVAKIHLQNNLEELDMSDYLYNQLFLGNPAGRLLARSKEGSLGLLSDLMSGNSSFVTILFKGISQIRRLLKI